MVQLGQLVTISTQLSFDHNEVASHAAALRLLINYRQYNSIIWCRMLTMVRIICCHFLGGLPLLPLPLHPLPPRDQKKKKNVLAYVDRCRHTIYMAFRGKKEVNCWSARRNPQPPNTSSWSDQLNLRLKRQCTVGRQGLKLIAFDFGLVY